MNKSDELGMAIPHSWVYDFALINVAWFQKCANNLKFICIILRSNNCTVVKIEVKSLENDDSVQGSEL
jgi:hypothetical protein